MRIERLKNCTEELVYRHVNERITGLGLCGCEECRLDIMAIMLNRLPPQYVVTETGALYAQLKQFDSQIEVDLAVAMAEAVAIVGKKPHHHAP